MVVARCNCQGGEVEWGLRKNGNAFGHLAALGIGLTLALVNAARISNSGTEIVIEISLDVNNVLTPPQISEGRQHHRSLNDTKLVADMLKGRSKAFAPKKVGPRKPAAPSVPTPSPSVERQSQTPAPTQQSQPNPVLNTEKDDGINAAPAEIFGNSVTADPSQTSIESPQSTRVTGRSPLKRKDREDDPTESATKRPALKSTRPDTLSQVESTQNTSGASIVESQSISLAQAVQVPADPTQSTSASAGALQQRKDSESDLLEPAAKHVSSSPQSQHVPTSQPPSAAPNAAHHDATTSAQAPKAATNFPSPASTQNATQQESTTPAGESRGRSKSPSATAHETPQHRYPSPENMVRIADDMPGRISAFGSTGQTVRNGNGLDPSQVITMASLNPDGTSGGMVEEVASEADKGKKKTKGKATTRGRKIQATANGDDDRPTVGMQLNRQRRTAGERRPRKRTEPRERQPRPRAITPEGASDEEIDHQAVTMADLCKDLKIGKKSSRHDDIMQMVAKKKQEAAAAKFRRDHPELAAAIGLGEASEGDANGEAGATENGEASNTSNRVESPEPQRSFASGPRMRIVNGNMVLDETSTVIDRHRNAQRAQEVMEVIEETDFSRLVTQGTHMKREKNQQWDGAAMELFYKGLRQFGTDFQMIAGLFPHRSRRQIKLKFNKEERDNPARINRALTGVKDPIDLEEWQKMGDTKLEDLAVIQAEQAKIDAEQKAEIERYEAAAAETLRRKKESIKGSDAARARRLLEGMASDEEDDGDEDGVGESAKENNPKGKNRGKGKTATARKRKKNVEDDNFEVVGTID